MCKIQDNKNLGYNTECEWQPNLIDTSQENLRLRTAAVAYMDDTTWIARSKENMQKILEEAKIFYKANDSQFNGSKSVLITKDGSLKYLAYKILQTTYVPF